MEEVPRHTTKPTAHDRRQWYPRLRYIKRRQGTLRAICSHQPVGKTTLAATVAQKVNERFNEANPGLASGPSVATFLPMDGYHLTRAQLSAMPDPTTAHARRGAAFTFDAPAFLQLVKDLRKPLLPESETIYAPSFDHAVKDPVARDIPIATTSRVIIFEGNYLSLGSGAPEWKEAAEIMDELWFVDVPEEVARKRLIARHVVSGIAANEEEAGKRADENDLVNGREIVQGKLDVHEMIYSREDKRWKPEEQGIDKERDD
jgi:pantothenate kinase